MPAYARVELGFSETRISDFMRLARKLDRLPAVKAALPDIGYTKVREIVEVATPRTEQAWLAAAQTSTRAELRTRVKRAKARKPAASLFDPAPGPAVEVPVRVSVEFTPEQHARWEALWEQLRKGGVAGERAEVLLEALHALSSTDCPATDNSENFRRRKSDPSILIHVHQCPDCAKNEVNGRELGRADAARVQCDAVVHEPGKRRHINDPATRPPRSPHQGSPPLPVPRLRPPPLPGDPPQKPRARGGTHEPANLITLCAACHRLWHRRC